MDGRISAFNPEAVRKPVDHQPIETVSPRPNAGSHPKLTGKMKIRMIPIRKRRERHPDQRTGQQQMADPRRPVETRVDPHGQPDRKCEHPRAKDQLERGRKPFD